MNNSEITLYPDDFLIGTRIDKYLSDEMEDLSRSYIQQLIDDEKILVNGRKVKSSYKLREKDSIFLNIPEPEELEIIPEDIPLNIVHEDEDILIIDKPQGMVVHPAAGHFTGTLVNAIMYHCKDQLSGINGIMRPGIVHRIDMNTSGLLVICKNDNAHRKLSEQFSVHSITREYTAICYNSFNKDEGTIDKPIARSKNDRKKMAIDMTGRRAVTHYKVEERLKQDFSLVKCRLETGRTHQIRVHMASINHPLLGDDVYGPKKCPFNLKGQMLHAGKLGFIHPGTNEYVEYNSELPDYFMKILKVLRKEAL
ncbi:ribosomal large subunit pseudouridine synthase D [Eubacterium ruminantium]|nr:ribosomal large subunit pseudouridine synthase D [Eubacterium ruminantium]